MFVTIAPSFDALTVLQRAEPRPSVDSRFRGQPVRERLGAFLAHALALLTGPIAPALVFAISPPDSFTYEHARESLNFQLTLLLVSVGLVLTAAVTVVVMATLAPLLMPVFVAAEVAVGVSMTLGLIVRACYRAAHGSLVRYPALRFFK